MRKSNLFKKSSIKNIIVKHGIDSVHSLPVCLTSHRCPSQHPSTASVAERRTNKGLRDRKSHGSRIASSLVGADKENAILASHAIRHDITAAERDKRLAAILVFVLRRKIPRRSRTRGANYARNFIKGIEGPWRTVPSADENLGAWWSHKAPGDHSTTKPLHPVAV